MLTEIYVWEKLRDLRTDAQTRPGHVLPSGGSNFGPGELIRSAGAALRRTGQRLERWGSAPAARAGGSPAELARRAHG